MSDSELIHHAIELTRHDVFAVDGDGEAEPFLRMHDWTFPVQYFVGRNGSGKSRTARALANKANGRLLSTDRLVGIMGFNNYGWGATPANYRGVPLGETERQQIATLTRSTGVATEELYALREQPEVWLRVAAFIRRTLGRSIELRENAGYLDPYVRMGETEYSLLRDEGHGLRELVILLAATYRSDWPVLVIDEPELHLHPSIGRLWLTELNRECRATGRRAIVVTHEPSFLRPTSAQELGAVWMFSAGHEPVCVADKILPVQEQRVTASLSQNPLLIGQIAFSPRPVLLEGVTDIAAFSTALSRLEPAEVVAQTDLVDCGGSGAVGLWLEICTKLGLDVKAVSDLDALFSPEMQRTIDALPGVTAEFVDEFAAEPGTTGNVVRQFIAAADLSGVGADPAQRADWLSHDERLTNGLATRKRRILDVLKRHGLWLHPQGTLEQLLGIEVKGVDAARAAAAKSSALDSVVEWAAYSLDVDGDVANLLGQAVERVAHAIMEAQRIDKDLRANAPVGSSAAFDRRLVNVEPAGEGAHRITVIAPEPFVDYWLEFSRETPSTALTLNPPAEPKHM